MKTPLLISLTLAASTTLSTQANAQRFDAERLKPTESTILIASLSRVDPASWSVFTDVIKHVFCDVEVITGQVRLDPGGCISVYRANGSPPDTTINGTSIDTTLPGRRYLFSIEAKASGVQGSTDALQGHFEVSPEGGALLLATRKDPRLHQQLWIEEGQRRASTRRRSPDALPLTLEVAIVWIRLEQALVAARQRINASARLIIGGDPCPPSRLEVRFTAASAPYTLHIPRPDRSRVLTQETFTPDDTACEAAPRLGAVKLKGPDPPGDLPGWERITVTPSGTTQLAITIQGPAGSIFEQPHHLTSWMEYACEAQETRCLDGTLLTTQPVLRAFDRALRCDPDPTACPR